ncbi:MAG: CAP domain-containing protein [Sandaracinus sp.]
MRHLIACFALTLVVAAAPVAAQDAFDGGAEASVDPREASGWPREASLLARINEIRQQAGAAPLQRDAGLDTAARVHSTEMAAADQLMHVSPTTGTPIDRVHAAGHDTGEVAENVAMHATAPEAQQALEASDAHLANMLNPRFTHVGLSVAPDENGVYVTQVFARLEAQPAAAQPAAAPTAPPIDVPAIVAAVPPIVADAVVPPASVSVPVPPISVEATVAPPASAAPAAPAVATAAGTPGQVLTVRTPEGATVGYWVCSSARWWYYPLPSGATSGQLQADLSVTGAPPGYGACAPGASGPVAIGGAAPAYGAPVTGPTYAAPRVATPGAYAGPTGGYGGPTGGVYGAPASAYGPGYGPSYGYRPGPVYVQPRVVGPTVIGPWGGVRVVGPQPYPARRYGRGVIVVR